MPEMTSQKALRHAVATVGSAVLIVCALATYFLRADTEMWLIFLVMILVPALLLLPLVYRRYMQGPRRPQLTRRQHITRTIMFGSLSIAYVAASVIDPTKSWRSVHTWIFGGAWMLMAIDHLRRAFKPRGEKVPTSQ
jgi:hypothetical protein